MIMIGIVIGILAWVLRQCLQALDSVKWTKTKEFAQVCKYYYQERLCDFVYRVFPV